MAKKKVVTVVAEKGLNVKVRFSEDNQFGRKLKVKVQLLQDGKVISEDEDFVKLPLK